MVCRSLSEDEKYQSLRQTSPWWHCRFIYSRSRGLLGCHFRLWERCDYSCHPPWFKGFFSGHQSASGRPAGHSRLQPSVARFIRLCRTSPTFCRALAESRFHPFSFVFHVEMEWEILDPCSLAKQALKQYRSLEVGIFCFWKYTWRRGEWIGVVLI